MKPKMALSFAKCERNVQVIQHHYSQCALHNITTSAGCYVVLGFFFFHQSIQGSGKKDVALFQKGPQEIILLTLLQE